MKDYFLKLCVELEERIEIARNEQSKSYLSLRIIIVESVLEKLRIFLINNPFESIEDEIHYFKNLKPLISSKLIQYKKLHSIEIEKPQGTIEEKKDHLESELKRLTRYCKSQKVFFQYLRSEKTDMDSTYFVRENAKKHPIFESYSSEIDYQAGTGYDHRIAVILAHELIETYLHEELDALNNPRPIFSKLESSPYDTTCGTPKLKWTDSQSSLVELIYGLYVNKTFNNGKADIKEIATFLEKTFNIKLNDVYRTFLDIKKRKTDKFKFIESMHSNLEEFSDDIFES